MATSARYNIMIDRLGIMDLHRHVLIKNNKGSLYLQNTSYTTLEDVANGLLHNDLALVVICLVVVVCLVFPIRLLQQQLHQIYTMMNDDTL